MSKYTAAIPRADVASVALYVNHRRKSLSQIKAETGADWIVNGGLYSLADWRACCHLKAAGQVLARDPYTYWGYRWNTGPDLELGVVPHPGSASYIACCALIRAGKAEPLRVSAALGGRRGRTAIGLKGDHLMLYCAGDGTADATTPEALQQELLAAGWDSAVLLDGGGSSQCDLEGEIVYSPRRVHHVLLVYRKGTGCPYPEPGVVAHGWSRQGALWMQWHLKQTGYYTGALDGSFGPLSDRALRNAMKGGLNMNPNL